MLALLKWHDSSFYTFPENFSTRYWLPVILNERFWMDTLSLFSHFFILLSSSDLLFYKKKWLGIFCTVIITIFKDFFFQCFIHLSKGREQKKGGKYIGWKERSSKRTYSFLCTSRWMLRASSQPGNQATWLKIRVNALGSFRGKDLIWYNMCLWIY